MQVLPTPLTKNENLDNDAVVKLVNLLVKNKMALFALGSSGEGMNRKFNKNISSKKNSRSQ